MHVICPHPKVHHKINWKNCIYLGAIFLINFVGLYIPLKFSSHQLRLHVTTTKLVICRIEKYFQYFEFEIMNQNNLEYNETN